MSKIDNATLLRKDMLRNGYKPLPNRDKRCFYPGWPSVTVTEPLVDEWAVAQTRHAATGMRLDYPLNALDVDVPIAGANKAIIDRWAGYLPDIFDGDVVLQRGTSASCKVAFFVRCKTIFKRKATRAYRIRGDDTADAIRVEIWGNRTPRQFGVYGPHRIRDNGEVVSVYQWPFEAPAVTPLDRVPWVEEAQLDELIRIADEELAKAGLELVPDKDPGGDTGRIVYDLTDEMTFQTNDDERLALNELKDAAKAAGKSGVRLSASFISETSENTTRCIARLTRNGLLLITDFETWRKHMEASLEKPGVKPEDVQQAFGALFDALGDKPEAIPDPAEGDDAAMAAAKILGRYALIGGDRSKVIRLDARSQGEAIGLQAFRDLMRPYCDEVRGPRGGVSTINPVDLWLSCPKRLAVDALELRPDLTQKVFEEDGRWYLNSYRPKRHSAGNEGDALVGRAWLRQIAPDAMERKYFLQWLAYKLRHPEVPGPAIVMVANDRFGTGRTTFARLLSLVFGEAYLRTVPFHILAGKSYQSQYNEWATNALITCVTETQETQGQSLYRMKHDTYAHLKELVEVHPHRREIIMKGIASRQMWCFTSYIIMTNDYDAVPMPGNDRRFFVMEGGQARRPVFWDAVNRWMKDPANVAAFTEWLLSVDLSDYSPYAVPPMTAAKRNMVDAGQSDLDRSLAAALASLNGKSEAFSMKHVLDKMNKMLGEEPLLEFPEKWPRVALRTLPKFNVHRIGARDGMNYKPKMKDGNRYACFAWNEKSAKKWTHADPGILQIELEKAGSVSGGFGRPALQLVPKDTSEDDEE